MSHLTLNFFNWWNTDANGHSYMTLMECAVNDWPVVALVFLGCLFIVLQYGDITIKNLKQYKKYPSSKIAKYSIHMVGVFAMCLVAGYLFRILSIWVNPYKLLVLLLLVLNVVTYLFRKSSKGLNIYYEIHELECKFKDSKTKINTLTKHINLNLFDSETDLQHIEYCTLDKIEYDMPFYSDDTEDLLNTRDRKGEPHFYAVSTGNPNGAYTKRLTHDTKKYLTCMDGSFYDKHTDRWYEKGDTLILEPFNWHFLVYGPQGVVIRTLILQP